MVHIRWMIRRDMDRVLEIEKSNIDGQWSQENLVNAMRNRNTIGMIAEVNDVIVGYMIYELEKKFLNILRFVVNPDCRGKGYGTAMLDKLKGKLSKNGRFRLHCDVDEDEFEAIGWLMRRGYRQVGKLHDVRLMRYIQTHPVEYVETAKSVLSTLDNNPF